MKNSAWFSHILFSLLTVGIVAGGSIYTTRAFFSDTETSTGNTFTAGAIDLKIGNESYYNRQLSTTTTWQLGDLTNKLFFNFNDLKPGDNGEDTVTLKVDNNDAWACSKIVITENDDKTCSEPEKIDEPNCNEPNSDKFDGELAENLNFLFWLDDGDNVFEEGEKILAQGKASDVLDGATWTLADSIANNLGEPNGQPLVGTKEYHIGKAWCFGNISINGPPQNQGSPTSNPGFSCDGTLLNNLTQTDTLLGDIEFSAIQARNNPGFLCEERLSCQPGWVSSVTDHQQGKRKDGSNVPSERSDSTKALNIAEDTGIVGTFYSLGFGGSITLGFSGKAYDKPGNDLSFHEVTNGTYPLETAKVEVAQNLGGPWIDIGTVDNSNHTVKYLDINGAFPWIKYVKLTDTSDKGPFEAIADGYDLDGIDATNLCIPVSEAIR